MESRRRQMRREDAKYGPELKEIPPEQWPPIDYRVQAVWRSKRYICVVYATGWPDVKRLSIERVDELNMSWEELLMVKRQCGFGDVDCVEVYPREEDVVNVANMRHLFTVNAERIPFAWRKEDEVPSKGRAPNDQRAGHRVPS